MFEKQYHTGEIHDTRTSGKVEIISDTGVFNKNGQRLVKIRYLDTGYEEDNVIYKNLLSGYGTDPTRFMFENGNKIFHSNNYGDYQIIEEVKDKNNNTAVKVRFLDTGYEYVARKASALEGKVKDKARFMYENKDKIFDSFYYGKFKIISEAPYKENDIHHKHKMVDIQFLNTGAIRTVAYGDCVRGDVSDPTYNNPKEASDIITENVIANDKLKEYLFSVWRNIKTRCEKSEFYKDAFLSEEWKNFDNFYYDAQRLPGWQFKIMNPLAFQIDKDLLQINIDGPKYYARNTCVWLDNNTNLAIANGLPVSIYYNSIYAINNVFFVKSSYGYFSYGPYFSLYDALQAPIY